MPSSDVHTRHFLASLVSSVVFSVLVVSVDMVVGLCHQSIVHVASIMPDAVFFVHAHVTHLHGEEIFHHRLPHTAVIHIAGNAEQRRLRCAVIHTVESCLVYIAEVCLDILIPKEIAPFSGADGFHEMLAVSIYAHQLCCR